MKFLNQKEQVIDLEITPYGKSLLSMGRFSPTYYAFYDDEVLYDSQYAGVLEPQNSASVRIKEFPQLEAQSYFYSAEKQVKEATALHRLSKREKEEAKDPTDILLTPYLQGDMVTIGTIADREFNKAPLGTSGLNSHYAPSWNVNVISGEISSSFRTSEGMNLPTPQLNMSASVFSFLLSTSSVGGNFYEFNQAGDLHPDNFLKNKFLNVIEKSIVLEIDESNTDYEWENFEIEVFEVEKIKMHDASTVDGGRIKEFLTPLFFKKSKSQIENGILIEPTYETVVGATNSSVITPNNAEYFFDFRVDAAIDQELLCKGANNPTDDLYSQQAVDCSLRDKQQKINIETLYEPDNAELCPEDED